MIDLSHWDFAESFCGYDAAALILGLEPRESELEQWRVNVVMDRMAQHYNNQIIALEWEVTSPEQRDEVDPTKLVGLASVKMTELHRLAWLYGADAPLQEWISRTNRQSQFENQLFARYSIVGWLKAIGMKSVYQFDLRQELPASHMELGRWPWGNHHTELLGHLAAAAQRYWVKYDPTDATTAPTNKDVAEWLIANHKVSQKMADAIASMLRPDGLPTGPRK
jgi:hypothetical protein